ncbi:hypothetical protein DPMN_105690 [Dreissena polymorpha]|uniref:Transcription factor SPT20 homolog n=1 Tax=Dreissena polymorpha TaxID=45954 RepID=A0A9D4K3P3_DREPO|nr:hypothetical protein DPMN_105690 [Dreissena polymorpha]
MLSHNAGLRIVKSLALQCNTHLLKKLVRREKLSCLILNLYAGNEGYSLMLRSKTGYIDDSEIRDFRRSTNGTFDMQYVLLKPNPQTLLCDINNLTSDGHLWTQEDLYLLEKEPLCLDPSPAVLLVANKQQYDRNKMNTPLLKSSVQYNQSALNRKRKIAQSPAPRELQLHDFITTSRRDKKTASPGAKLSKTTVDFWKQKQVPLSTPEVIDVEKFAKVKEKQERTFMEENTLSLLEEHVLERDGMQDKKLLAKLTILHRPSDDAHIGELYLDHDYREDKSVGATCRFLLGSKDSVKKYLDQFREIFTEEGRREVKITIHRPGQRTIVTCTQTLPTELPSANVGVNMGTNKTVTSTPLQELGPGALGAQKRQMPIQLQLSIPPPGGTPTPPLGTSISQQDPADIANQCKPVSCRPVSTVTSHGQPVTVSVPEAQAAGTTDWFSDKYSLFTSPTSQGTQPFLAQPSTPGGSLPTGSRTPTHTPTPPPPIVSMPGQLARKPSLTNESSTIHHMAQTTHHVNISSYVQGKQLSVLFLTILGTRPTPFELGKYLSSANNIVHHHQQQQQQQQHGGMLNITGIPPNINIQNLTGLPGMNIANLQGLQNMQSTGEAASLTNPQGILVTSTQPVQTTPDIVPRNHIHDTYHTRATGNPITHGLVESYHTRATGNPITHGLVESYHTRATGNPITHGLVESYHTRATGNPITHGLVESYHTRATGNPITHGLVESYHTRATGNVYEVDEGLLEMLTECEVVELEPITQGLLEMLTECEVVDHGATGNPITHGLLEMCIK